MKIHKRCFFLITGLFITSEISAQQSSSNNYTFNRAPLKQGVYMQLPLGSIKAKGWLLKQLELQRDGFTGHAEELYPGDNDLGPNSDWLGGTGNGWEKVAYYVKGLVSLAYTLDDEGLKNKAKKWINYTLEHQQEDGLFGPPKMKDWWPRMPYMYALQSYYEATNDHRVIPCLTKYFKYQLAHLDAAPLDSWGKSRAGDNIELVLWVYNKTGDADLLQLADKLKTQAYQWQDIFSNNKFHFYGDDYQPRHMVNVAQALKFPAVVSEFSPEPIYTTAMQKGIDHIMFENGQPEGLGAGTEHMSGHSSVEGVETCTVVEWMQSLETASRVFHNARIGDQLEKVAFNALPAQFSRDLKEHSYYTQPNEVRVAEGQHGFNQDYGNGLLLSPYSGFPCCRYNMHMGWPYFVKNSALATPDGGLAINTYGPMEISALVGKGNRIKITENTNYPFEEQIRLNVTLSGSASFPVKLRIPSWCSNPQVSLNGKPLAGVKSGELFLINRKWSNNDQITINFPMHVETEKQVNNAVSVERGPIVYSLKINEAVTNLKEHKIAGFYDKQILPSSPWNYGLLFNSDKLNDQFKVLKGSMTDDPFQSDQSPVQLVVKAKQIPSWTLDQRGTSAFDVPLSPVPSTEKTEDVTLVPFGSQNIRISVFPTIGTTIWNTKQLTEDFTGNTARGWVIYGGRWYYENDAINCGSIDVNNSGSGAKIVATGTNFANFIYKAKVAVNSEGDAGIIFRVARPAIGAEAYEGYYLGLNALKGTIELGKSSNGKWIVIASAKKELKTSVAYQVKVKADGDKFEVFINNSDSPIITANDSEFKTGNIGLRTYHALARIDDVEVTALK